MSKHELESKVAELRELRRMADEIAAEIAATEDSLKAYMSEKGAEELHGIGFRITWKPVTTTRLDGKSLKAEMPELWTRYSKQTTARRFILA